MTQDLFVLEYEDNGELLDVTGSSDFTVFLKRAEAEDQIEESERKIRVVRFARSEGATPQ